MLDGLFCRKRGKIPLGLKALKGDPGGLLLSLLFCEAFGFGERASASEAVRDVNLDAEELLMVGPALGGEDILRLTCSGGLKVLLQGGLVVADGSAEGIAGAESSLEIGEGRLDDMALDKGTGHLESTVEIEGGYDGFEGVGEQGGFLAASALLFSSAEAEHGSETDALGDGPKVAAADERGAEAGEFSLASVGEAAVEAFGNSQAEDSIADELELFVVRCGTKEGFRAGFVGERTMGEGEGKQIRTLEVMVPGRGRRLARWDGYGLSAARRHAALLSSKLQY
jgi:hypothetical protein